MSQLFYKTTLTYDTMFDTMNNYYNSVKLTEYLLMKKIRICGTIRRNRGFPRELNNLKLKRGESHFLRKNEVLALMWKNKRDVRMVSTIHNIKTNKVNRKRRCNMET